MKALTSFHDSDQTIGQRVRVLRRQWKMTQQDVAEAIDITTNYLGQIERGEKPLTLPIAEQLCLLFCVTYDYFFLGLERPAEALLTDGSAPALRSDRDAIIHLALSSDDDECADYWDLLRAANKLRDDDRRKRNAHRQN